MSNERTSESINPHVPDTFSAVPIPPGAQVLLDTSALIADPDVVDAYGAHEVVIPLTVVEELDGLKSRSDEVGWMARTSLRVLEARRLAAGGSLEDGLPLAGGGRVRVEVNGIQRHLLDEFGLDHDKADNRIIGAALGLRDVGPVVVVSNDAAFRIKAAHLGLQAREHVPNHLLGDPGPGWHAFDTSRELIDTVYAQRSVEPFEITASLAETAGEHDEPERFEPVENSFVVLRAPSQSVMLRVRDHELTMLDQNPPSAWSLRPRSKEQRFALELLLDPEVSIVALDGPAGTGKSLLAVAAGLEQVVEQGRYDRLSVFRSLMPVGREELGFLPGDIDDKVLPHFAAFFDAVTALTERRSARDGEKMVEQLRAAGQLTLEPVTFLRGRSISRSFIIVDEAQNLERSVLKTLLTRVSEGTKIVFTGDVSQIDNPFGSTSNNAITALIQSFAGQSCFGHVRLTTNERSEVAALAADLL